VGFGGYRVGYHYWAERSYRAHFHAAQAARRSGSLTEAQREIQECARLQPDSPELVPERALLAAQQGEVREADTLVNSRANLDRGDLALARDALVRHAVREMERRDFARAYVQLGLCLRLAADDAAVQLLSARCARRGKSYVVAEKHLAACARLEGATPEVELEQMLLQVQQGRLKPAEPTLLSLVDQDHPDSLLILEALTEGYMLSARLDPALRCIERWLVCQPRSIQALLWRAALRERTGSFPSAAADYEQVLRLDPNHGPTRLHLAQLLLDGNRAAEARPHFERLYERDPDNPQVLLGLARCRRSDGQPTEAARLLDRLPRAAASDVVALVERGQVAQGLGRTQEAEQSLRRAVAVAPNDPAAQYALYGVLRKRNSPEAATVLQSWERLDRKVKLLEELKPRLLKDPENLELRRRVGTLCLETGRNDEGIWWLESIVLEGRADRNVHELLAAYYERHGQPDSAARHRRLAAERRS
jgi:tetratricopeptide (TPR) repeat protein